MLLILQMEKLRLQAAAGASQSPIISWSERGTPFSRAPLLSGPSTPTSALYLDLEETGPSAPSVPLLVPPHSTGVNQSCPTCAQFQAKSGSPDPMCLPKGQVVCPFTKEDPERAGVRIPSFNTPRATQQAQFVAWASQTEHILTICVQGPWASCWGDLPGPPE